MTDDLAAQLGGQHQPGLLEGPVVDDRWMGDLVGVDPLRVVVPAHPGEMTQRDVVDVEQIASLIAALDIGLRHQPGRAHRGRASPPG